MEKILLDAATVRQLSGIETSAEIFDPSGNLLGYFSPKVDPSPNDEIEPPIGDEE